MENVSEKLTTLYELQQVDTKIANKIGALQDLDDGTEADEALQQAEQKLEELQQQQQQIESEYRDKNLELESTESEREKKADQAYGGTIADPKKLDALENKIEELDRRKDKLEDEILQLLEENEQAQEAVQQQQQVVEDRRAEMERIKDRYDRVSNRLQGEIQQLKDERNEIIERIDDDLMEQYRRLLDKMNGIAVAAVRDGSCTACNVRLPTIYLKKLKKRAEIIYCENCRRILYLPPEEQ